MNILRRLPLSRLLLLCGAVVAIGASATALALGLDTGPVPAPKPLAQAVHDALSGASAEHVPGVSASITLTDHLLEGASLATNTGGGPGAGGGLTSSPLVTGASGRLWIAEDGDLRLELQSEQGDTQILYDGHTVQLYDAATNTVYRYTPPTREQEGSAGGWTSYAPDPRQHEVPSVAKIEEAISHLSQHANVSGASPTDVAGQPAYTVRVSPKEGGSLLGGAEVSWDANNGVPLRTAIYSSTTGTPVIELAASEVSFGPVSDSVFELDPPANAKIEEVSFSRHGGADGSQTTAEADKPQVTTHGHGVSAITLLESRAKDINNKSIEGQLEELPKVTINGTSASELRTELGTVLTFERSGVRYLLAGAVAPAAIEELARGL
jgi:outer membrane lipoprotein-sorting protein